MARRVAHQPDLFSQEPSPLGAVSQGREKYDWLYAGPTGCLVDTLDEHPGEAFIERIRRELYGMLELVRASVTLPWDLTTTYMREMHMNSKTRWLPVPEAKALRLAFKLEMDRLYELEDLERPEVHGWNF